MIRIAKSEARKNFSDVVTRAGRRGERVKITHYGKTLAILISPRELESLDDCERRRRDKPADAASRDAKRPKTAVSLKARRR